MRHRRRADLAGLEALGHQLVARPSAGSSWPATTAPAASWTSADTHLVVQRARVDLADAGRTPARSRGGRRPGAPARPASARVAAEQVEHVLRGADRALDAAQRVAARAAPRAGRRPPAARRPRSRTACPAWWPARRRCASGRPSPASAYSAASRAQPGQHGHRAVAHQLQRQRGSAAARRSRSGRGWSCPCGSARARRAR